LLEVQKFPVYEDTDRGMMRMNTDTYYRLLNWGLQLAVGAGSATGVKQAPVGYNRAYVRAASNSTLNEFNATWKAGKNFVTNGPMLFLTTRDGQRPGDTIKLPSEGGTVRFDVEALADQRIFGVELIVNGKVAASLAVDNPRHVKGMAEIEIKNGSWIAARCTARDGLLTDKELAVYRQGDVREQYCIRPSRLRFAHTSPIYVTVGGQGTAVRKSIDEGLQMLDRFEVFARATAGPKYRSSILAAVQQARRKLQTRLSTP